MPAFRSAAVWYAPSYKLPIPQGTQAGTPQRSETANQAFPGTPSVCCTEEEAEVPHQSRADSKQVNPHPARGNAADNRETASSWSREGEQSLAGMRPSRPGRGDARKRANPCSRAWVQTLAQRKCLKNKAFQ